MIAGVDGIVGRHLVGKYCLTDLSDLANAVEGEEVGNDPEPLPPEPAPA